MIEITVSYSGKISGRKQYENFSPMYSVKEVIDGELNDTERNRRIRAIQADLKAMFRYEYEKLHDSDDLYKIKPKNPECHLMFEQCEKIIMDDAEHIDYSRIMTDLRQAYKDSGAENNIENVKNWTTVKEYLDGKAQDKQDMERGTEV